MTSFQTEIRIDAPVEHVWEVLADIGTIYQWNPGVRESYTTSAEATGLGASRFCDLGGDNYLNEQVVEFDYRRRLTMRITGTNLPLKEVDIRFTLATENDGTRVTCAPEYELKFGPLGALMDRFYVRGSYEKGMDSLLRGLKRHVETESRQKIGVN